MNTETYSYRFERYGQTCSRTRIIAESAKKVRMLRHLTCTGSFGPSVASQQSLKRPGVLQVGHQADMQRGTGAHSKASKVAQSLFP